MKRIAVLLLALAACDVGDATVNRNGVDGGSGTDSGSNHGTDSGNGCIQGLTGGNITAAHIHAASGTSNRGQNCMVGGCHGVPAGAGGQFEFAGTLSTAADGGTPKGGAVISITPSGGSAITAYTDTDGNFYLAGATALTVPAQSLATSCPSITAMVSALTTGGGACNSCHAIAGTTSPMYLQ